MLTNKRFKDQIEKEKDLQGYGCQGLKNAKYINALIFNFNLKQIFNND